MFLILIPEPTLIGAIGSTMRFDYMLSYKKADFDFVSGRLQSDLKFNFSALWVWTFLLFMTHGMRYKSQGTDNKILLVPLSLCSKLQCRLHWEVFTLVASTDYRWKSAWEIFYLWSSVSGFCILFCKI